MIMGVLPLEFDPGAFVVLPASPEPPALPELPEPLAPPLPLAPSAPLLPPELEPFPPV